MTVRLIEAGPIDAPVLGFIESGEVDADDHGTIDGNVPTPGDPTDAAFWELWGEWGRDAAGRPKACAVRTLIGTGSDGNIWADEVPVPGLPQTHKQRLVRNSDGDEITSNTRVRMPLSYAHLFPLGSLVKPAYEGWTPVAAVTVTDDPDLPSVAVDLG
jgi:hypothetical protein